MYIQSSLKKFLQCPTLPFSQKLKANKRSNLEQLLKWTLIKSQALTEKRHRKAKNSKSKKMDRQRVSIHLLTKTLKTEFLVAERFVQHICLSTDNKLDYWKWFMSAVLHSDKLQFHPLTSLLWLPLPSLLTKLKLKFLRWK